MNIFEALKAGVAKVLGKADVEIGEVNQNDYCGATGYH